MYSTDTGTLVFISPTGRAYLEPPTMPDVEPGIRGVESHPPSRSRLTAWRRLSRRGLLGRPDDTGLEVLFPLFWL